MKQLYEFLINSRSTGIIKDNDFIDLGLSVLWAKCNIGAEKETDFGHYYQWGGLKSHDINFEFNWENTPFNNNEDECDEEYFEGVKNKVCPNGILNKKYDVAYKIFGGKAHIPTKENFKELVEETSSETIEDYNGSGVNGRIFTGKNSNSIFMPFSPFQIYNYSSTSKKVGFLWSSSLYDKSFSHYFNFSNIDSNVDYTDYGNRCCGIPIRPVKDK